MLMRRLSGEAVAVSRRVPMTDDQIFRARALQMYRMRLDGQTTREIARYFCFTPRYVNREIRDIPESARRRVERALPGGAGAGSSHPGHFLLDGPHGVAAIPAK
jgi:hypothetical protein